VIGKSPANRLYMYLPLKGDTNDYSTNAQNPTNTGVTSTTGQFGESNGAYNWADTGDNLNWSSTIGQNIVAKINNEITFFYFVKSVSITLGTFRFTAHQWSSDSNASFALINNNSAGNPNSYWFIQDVSGSQSRYSDNNALTTNWNGFAFTTKDNTTNLDIKWFKDGEAVGTNTIGYNTKTSSSLQFRIGAQSTVNTLGNLGQMHTFRIYNKALTQGEIKILHNEKGRIGLPKKLLLDNYSGSAVAYSLRKLRYNYSGSAIRVRRASDNAEQDIGFVSNELDTTSLATFCSGTNGFVVTWYDQSGNSRNATQITTANQPRIYNSSTGVLLVNSKPSLFFDGSNDGLSHSAISGTKFASFTVSKFETQLEIYQIIYSSKKSSGGSYSTFGASLLSYNNNTTMYFNTREGGSVGDTITYSNPGTNQILFSAYNDGAGAGTSNMKLFANGIEKGSSTNADPISFNASNYYDIGQERGVDPSSLHGYIQEVIMYTSADQSNNRIGIETNINSYYGVY